MFSDNNLKAFSLFMLLGLHTLLKILNHDVIISDNVKYVFNDGDDHSIMTWGSPITIIVS